jgi:hypothetical protein
MALRTAVANGGGTYRFTIQCRKSLHNPAEQPGYAPRTAALLKHFSIIFNYLRKIPVSQHENCL